MGVTLPDPKTVIDSIGDGAVELLQTGSRIGEKQSAVLATYASALKGVAEDIKAKMPDDPSVLPNAAIKTIASTFKAAVGTGESIVGGIDETVKGLKSQIDRVIK